jgi:hypothetical protein
MLELQLVLGAASEKVKLELSDTPGKKKRFMKVAVVNDCRTSTTISFFLGDKRTLPRSLIILSVTDPDPHDGFRSIFDS